MLILNVSIHSGLNPPPEALVPAVRFKLRLPMKMWSTRPMSSSWAPPWNSSNPTFLRQSGDMLCQPPIAQTTHMRPGFDVGSIEKYVHSNIPLMKYFVPFQCPICARWRADNWPAQLPEMNVETLQMSIVHSAMSTSKACHWWHYRFKIP